MKAAFWISVVFSAPAALGVFQDKGTEWVIVSLLLSGMLCVLAGFLAVGIKRRGIYGWWIGAVLLWLLSLGFLSNILHASGEKELGIVIWIVVSQLGFAVIPVWIYFSWWKPKRKSYFQASEGENQLVQTMTISAHSSCEVGLARTDFIRHA